MGRWGVQFLLACLFIGFGIFYGVNMAKQGVEYVYGKTETVAESKSGHIRHVENAPVEKKVSVQKQVTSESPIVQATDAPVSDKLIHRIANKTGEVVHTTMHQGVEMIVSLFEKVIY